MDDLMKYLYEFTQAHRMGGLYQDEEYEEYSNSVRIQEARVRGCLTEEQRLELRILLESISAQKAIESEHLFRALLLLARELNILAG